MLSYCVVLIKLTKTPHDIIQGLIVINPNIFVCGLLPHDEFFFVNRVIIDEINGLLSFKCSVNNFHFIYQRNGWILNNTALDFSLFYSDGLHLVEKDNIELGKSILKAIDCAITGTRMSYCYKYVVHSTSFNFNLENFPVFLVLCRFVIPSVLVNPFLK